MKKKRIVFRTDFKTTTAMNDSIRMVGYQILEQIIDVVLETRKALLKKRGEVILLSRMPMKYTLLINESLQRKHL